MRFSFAFLKVGECYGAIFRQLCSRRRCVYPILLENRQLKSLINGPTMRSHSLKNLSIAGRETVLKQIPEFDFYNVRRVTKINWSDEHLPDSDRTNINVTLAATYDDEKNRQSSAIQIRCSGVKQLRLPDLGSSFWLSEVEVEDIAADQIEDARYRIKDFGGTSFEAVCADIELAIE